MPASFLGRAIFGYALKAACISLLPQKARFSHFLHKTANIVVQSIQIKRYNGKQCNEKQCNKLPTAPNIYLKNTAIFKIYHHCQGDSFALQFGRFYRSCRL
ncbi:MAG: hypothetical protein Q4G13_08475 [Moraxella sp.]|nr:hypothetical protein [Moraxella sp.]